MSIKQETVSVNGSFTSLSISGTTSKSGNMTWTLPTLHDGYTVISTSLEASCTLSMSRGNGTYTINGNSYNYSTSISLDLGTTLISSMNVTAKGGNKNARGTFSISNIVYTITYEYDDGSSTPPIITIQSQDKDKISNVTGYDRCTVSFTSDQALSYWEARATTQGVTPAHGVGLLVESGTLGDGEMGYVYVDDEELTNGDSEYTVSIFGQNADGVWSDE